MTAEQLLTVEQLAAYLAVPKATVYSWRSRGQGPPAIKVGTLVRYRLGDVDAWIEDHLEPEPTGEDQSIPQRAESR